eukprot:9220313-Pyramimonas_sp.AAC.1
MGTTRRDDTQSALGALLDMACDRLAYVLRRLFELALVRMRFLAEASGLDLDPSAGASNQALPAPPVAFQTVRPTSLRLLKLSKSRKRPK